MGPVGRNCQRLHRTTVTAQLSVRRGERERAQEQAETEMLRPKGHNDPIQSIGLSLEHFEAVPVPFPPHFRVVVNEGWICGRATVNRYDTIVRYDGFRPAGKSAAHAPRCVFFHTTFAMRASARRLFRATWGYRRDAIVDLITKEDPDVLALQEDSSEQLDYVRNALKESHSVYLDPAFYEADKLLQRDSGPKDIEGRRCRSILDMRQRANAIQDRRVDLFPSCDLCPAAEGACVIAGRQRAPRSHRGCGGEAN